MFRRCVLALILSLAGSSVALAQEDVYVRGKEKPLKGKVTAEGPKGVTVGLKDTVLAEDIVDVVYDVQPISAKLAYAQAAKVEKDSLDPNNEPNRKKLIAEAMKKFEEVHAAVSEKDFKAARRHLEYKIAMLRVRQTREDGEDAKKAISALQDFSKKHTAGWQIGSVVSTLGDLLIEQKDYDAAEAAYRSLAAVEGLPEETKQDAELSAIQVKISAGKHAEAKAALQKLQASLPKNSKFAARARVTEAACLAEENQLDAASKIVRDIIKESTDRDVKAVAHNTLGYCYFKQGQMKEARWEFLWVDVVYNQDRFQHAKALFHLWKIFADLGEAERAQECRELLLSSQFAGLDYQRQAQKEAAKAQ